MTPRWVRERRKGRSLRRRVFGYMSAMDVAEAMSRLPESKTIYLYKQDKPDWWG